MTMTPHGPQQFSAPTDTAAIQALHELRAARDLLPEVEIARRARLVLDRAGFKEIDLVDFLAEKGYRGADLVRAAAAFGRTLADAYEAHYGVRPLKALEYVEHLRDHRVVSVYLEVDLPLIEETFGRWSA